MSEVTAVNPLSDTRVNAQTGVAEDVRSIPTSSLLPPLRPPPGSSLFMPS